MRDLLVLLFTIGSTYLGVFRPWMGVLALAVLGYMNPHRYAWGYTRSLPIYSIVFMATAIGLVLTRDKQSFPLTRETCLFLVLLIWFTLTTFFMPDFPGPAKTQWIKVMKIYMGIFPMFWLINTPEKLRFLVITIAISFGLIGLKGGIFAFGTGFSHRVWGPSATFYYDNNHIALALNMTLPLLFILAHETKNKIIKYFFYATFFFCVCSVISTWSRGGFLTLIAVILGLLYRSRKKWIIVPLLIAGVFVAIPNLPEGWFDRMGTIQTYEEDGSAMGRIGAWNYAWNRALQDPLTGGGFETFLEHGRAVHSAYFGILGEHGFVALSLWLFLLLSTMLMLSKLRKQALMVPGMEWIKPYAEAIQILFGAYAVGGAFLTAQYWDYFYQLIAICALMKLFLYREIVNQRKAMALK